MGRSAPPLRGFEPVADFDALDRLDSHQRSGQSGIESPVPVHVAAQTRRKAVGEDLDHAAERFAFLVRRIDLGHHRSGGLPVEASQRIGIQGEHIGCLRQCRAFRHRYRADRNGVADQGDAELVQESGCHGTQCDAYGGLPGAGPFQNRAGFIEAVLLHSGEIRVPGARPGQWRVPALACQLRRVHRVGGHDLFPFGPFGIADGDRDRAALGAAVPDAAEQLHLVLFEFHPGTAAITEPAAGECGLDVLGAQFDAGGQTLDDPGQCRAMGFTGSKPTQHRYILP